jgi:hypothetical protein
MGRRSRLFSSTAALRNAAFDGALSFQPFSFATLWRVLRTSAGEVVAFRIASISARRSGSLA